MQVQPQITLKWNQSEDWVVFFCLFIFFFLRLPDIKTAWINPCGYVSLKPAQI